ncbi:hypothetical protein RB623_24205 [Mesorhizobium sp. LHD-90]|uniref:hypothetical protein n=1 Tax=Mesorhizobium sp. LHD-90 TaxID=3071414 RepID=UPI0027E0747F|nr:hypothetical protein [Mesorhizobium sp. LHD-90]MDQ6437168.1 hypothetical protein [Mesorhizobium sp. LHD-90]
MGRSRPLIAEPDPFVLLRQLAQEPDASLVQMIGDGEGRDSFARPAAAKQFCTEPHRLTS